MFWNAAMSQPASPRADDVIDAIARHNAGRDAQLLAMKYARMAQSPFAFLRGSCHLFYTNLPAAALLRSAPLAWSCGDLHFENFGSYQGDNRQVYFDIGDFDEAALAPASWDLLRLLASIQCGSDTLNATADEALAVSLTCLAAYRAALGEGKPLWVERETSVGLINHLLSDLRQRERADFLAKRTTRDGRKRRLKLDGVKALPASAAQRQEVGEFMAAFAATQADPDFFRVLDIGRRIAGTGSLGLLRFVVLVAGKGSPDDNLLLDLKESRPSALAAPLARLGIAQPAWADEANRIAAIQQRMQAVEHAFLHAVKLGALPCILKELQPSEDRVAIGEWGKIGGKNGGKSGNKKLERLEQVVAGMARILAWDQLRASGRAGSANADALIDFAQRDDWDTEILAAAAEMTRTNRMQWQQFTQALQRRHPALALRDA